MLVLHAFQLDLCQKMAECLARTTARSIVRLPLSLCMGGRDFSSCGSYHLGQLVDRDTGARHNWSSCNYGWNCSFIGFLFNYALVENTMAKLKYAFP